MKKYTLLLKNEFAYNRGTSKSYNYGCIYKLKREKALVPYVYRSFKLEKGIPAYFACLFESKYLDRQLRRLISSSARMDGLLNINQEDFYKCQIPFPCQEEQIKISHFASALENKIARTKYSLKKLKNWKNGLLQKMFI